MVAHNRAYRTLQLAIPGEPESKCVQCQGNVAGSRACGRAGAVASKRMVTGSTSLSLQDALQAIAAGGS